MVCPAKDKHQALADRGSFRSRSLFITVVYSLLEGGSGLRLNDDLDLKFLSVGLGTP